jgi:hypothetical protein
MDIDTGSVLKSKVEFWILRRSATCDGREKDKY